MPPKYGCLCCMCGVPIEPNPATMCIACLSSKVDITEHINKQQVLTFCPKCERYLVPPNKWLSFKLESPELLSMCLKRIKGLHKDLKLKDAKFIWTESHSKRILVEITVQRNLEVGGCVEQNAIIEYTIHSQQCMDCHRFAAKDFWNAVVQLRQRVSHKKTLLYLEQLLLNSKAHKNCSNIKQVKGGIDFFFSSQGHALHFLEYIAKHVPCRYQTSQQLKSHDPHNNTYNYKWTYSVDVVPICKDDLVCLPKQLAQKLGNMNPLCLVYRVTQKIHLIDPQTCTLAEVDTNTYFANPFSSIATISQYTKYLVMELEKDYSNTQPHFDDRASMMSFTSSIYGAGHGPISKKHSLVGAWLMKESQVGQDFTIGEMEVDEYGSGREIEDENCGMVFTYSHLGHLLREGDYVLAFDLCNSNVNNAEFDKLKKRPDVLIIKKIHPADTRSLPKITDSERTTAKENRRCWELQRLCVDAAETDDNDFNEDEANEALNDFMQDLEDDQELAKGIVVKRGEDLINLHELIGKMRISDDARMDS